MKMLPTYNTCMKCHGQVNIHLVPYAVVVEKWNSGSQSSYCGYMCYSCASSYQEMAQHGMMPDNIASMTLSYGHVMWKYAFGEFGYLHDEDPFIIFKDAEAVTDESEILDTLIGLGWEH